MASFETFPLQAYDNISKYEEVCRKRFGRTYDLVATVKQFSELRRPDRILTARHVAALFNPEETHFGHFWKPARDLEQTLDRRPISLAKPDDAGRHWREEVVASVFEFLGSVEAVSVLLRCTQPDDFAVYSPPILNLLQLPAEPPVDHYLAYCDELRVWGTHFGTGGVANTDQALWVFYELAYGPACLKMEDPDGKNAQARRDQFENDRWVRERQAGNVLRPFFHKWSTLEQAECLADIDTNLAGKIAGCEFEQRLRRATGLEDEEVPSLIQHFTQASDPDPALRRKVKGRLRRIWKLRNRTVHAKSDLSQEEVKVMIDIIRELLPEE